MNYLMIYCVKFRCNILLVPAEPEINTGTRPHTHTCTHAHTYAHAPQFIGGMKKNATLEKNATVWVKD